MDSWKPINEHQYLSLNEHKWLLTVFIWLFQYVFNKTNLYNIKTLEIVLQPTDIVNIHDVKNDHFDKFLVDKQPWNLMI